jgi:hypothetical protein
MMRWTVVAQWRRLLYLNSFQAGVQFIAILMRLEEVDEALRLGLARFGKLGDEGANFVETPREILRVGQQGDDGNLIGIRAALLNRYRIGRHSIVGAGALVSEDKVFPDRALIGSSAPWSRQARIER